MLEFILAYSPEYYIAKKFETEKHEKEMKPLKCGLQDSDEFQNTACR